MHHRPDSSVEILVHGIERSTSVVQVGHWLCFMVKLSVILSLTDMPACPLSGTFSDLDHSF